MVYALCVLSVSVTSSLSMFLLPVRRSLVQLPSYSLSELSSLVLLLALSLLVL